MTKIINIPSTAKKAPIRNKTFICVFKCEDKTFYWGPFKTLEEAQDYAFAAKDQTVNYYGKDIAKRSVVELYKPLK